MKSNLDLIKQKLIPNGTPPERPTERDWQALEARGFALPQDYKDFLSHYGSGWLKDYIQIFNPIPADGQSEWETNGKEMNAILSEMREEFPDLYGEDFSIYPEPGGLLPIGKNPGAAFLWWKTEGDPDEWTVVFGEAPDLEFFDVSFSEFIIRWLDDPDYLPVSSDGIASPRYRYYA